MNRTCPKRKEWSETRRIAAVARCGRSPVCAQRTKERNPFVTPGGVSAIADLAGSVEKRDMAVLLIPLSTFPSARCGPDQDGAEEPPQLLREFTPHSSKANCAGCAPAFAFGEAPARRRHAVLQLEPLGFEGVQAHQLRRQATSDAGEVP